MDFFKYQGIGNDFILIDERGQKNSTLAHWQPKAQKICDRHLGIGGDGLLILSDSSTAQIKMTVINADGSVPEMCGNGIRCAARHAYFLGDTKNKDKVTVDTGAGVLTCQNLVKDGHYNGSKVAMGKPIFDPSQIPTTLRLNESKVIKHPLRVKGRELETSFVSMGNPHCVAFAHHRGDKLLELAQELGPLVEKNTIFPQKTNVEFVYQVSPTLLEVVVWERGCGITQACGTGATATAVIACLLQKSPFDTPIEVKLPGGTLTIEVDENFSQTWMSGPADHVFNGTLDNELIS